MEFGVQEGLLAENVIPLSHSRKPITASGEFVSAGIVQLPVINLLGYEAKNRPFLIILDEDKDFRNLLGRDLLAGFNFKFDNDGGMFEIGRARTFKKLGEYLPGQRIGEIAESGADGTS